MSLVPQVSVVIPTHDRWDLLASTLRTVLAQRDVDLEVIVVDDGSPTSPDFVPDDSRLHVVRQPESRGVAEARNVGLARARGRWVAFTDDDDLWAPDKLTAQLAALATSGARWACCGAVVVDNDLRVISKQRAAISGDVADELLVANKIPGGGSGVLAEAAVVRDVGGFDTAFGMFADWDLWVRLALGAPLASVDRPLLAYRVHAGAMSWRHGGIRDELARFEAKHAVERTVRGLDIAYDSLELWMADRGQRAGVRIASARGYLRSTARIGRTHAVLRAGEALVWPRAHHARDRRWGRRVPEAWQVEVAPWLEAALQPTSWAPTSGAAPLGAAPPK